MNERRKDKCTCGSTIKALEIMDNKVYVICVGIGCNKKHISKRLTDKLLPKFKEVAKEFNG